MPKKVQNGADNINTYNPYKAQFDNYLEPYLLGWRPCITIYNEICWISVTVQKDPHLQILGA